MNTELLDPRKYAESEIDRVWTYRENHKDLIAWFTLACAALRIFALFVDSYMKRDR